MFARVSTFQGSPDQSAEGIRVAREQVVPAARLQEGFKGIYLLFDRASGKSLSITLWETEDDMLESEQAANKARGESVRSAGDSVTSVERYEVALAELER